MRIKVLDKQTIFDIALQYTGSIDTVNDILLANGKEDDELRVGEELEIPEVMNKPVAEWLENNQIRIATKSCYSTKQDAMNGIHQFLDENFGAPSYSTPYSVIKSRLQEALVKPYCWMVVHGNVIPLEQIGIQLQDFADFGFRLGSYLGTLGSTGFGIDIETEEWFLKLGEIGKLYM